MEDVLREVLHKVNECIQWYLIQAVFRENEPILLLLNLSGEFWAPKLELIKEVAQSVITELVLGDHLEAEGVRDEWNDDWEVTIVDIDLDISLSNQMDEWDPVVVCRHLSHEIGQGRLL